MQCPPAPSFKAPFGVAPALSVAVDTVERFHSARSLAGQQENSGASIRARAWGEDCKSVCAHLLVVNIDQSSPASFTLSVHGLPQLPMAGINATRLFSASYNVTLSATGALTDWIGAGDTNVYEIGCEEPKEANGWRACSNRRVVCKHGFTSQRGTIPPTPHNATCEPVSA